MTTPPACAIPGQLPHLRVVLIHGLWNPAIWLLPLARRLRCAGFEADMFSYSSVFERPDIAISHLAARLRGSNENVALIGHSLGGLIALETLRQHQGLAVPRVVCLGSPLLGSRTAQTLIARGWETWTLGRSAALLQAGCAPWQGRAQVGRTGRGQRCARDWPPAGAAGCALRWHRQRGRNPAARPDRPLHCPRQPQQPDFFRTRRTGKHALSSAWAVHGRSP